MSNLSVLAFAAMSRSRSRLASIGACYLDSCGGFGASYTFLHLLFLLPLVVTVSSCAQARNVHRM